MCGIVGKLNISREEPIEVQELAQMLGMIRHRGPDEFGVYLDDQVGLGSARLSIIDLSSGHQPIHNEDETVWLVFNGEIFNYIELRAELEAAGHRFYTHTDTEVIVHLYEEHGPDCVQRMNGQFAVALWDTRQRTLFLMRDRVGIRPLYYTFAGGRLLFASEIKALMVASETTAEIEPEALAQLLTFWTTLSPHTAFRDVHTVPPGHIQAIHEGQTQLQPYWRPDFAPDENGPRDTQEAAHQLRELLIDATRLQLRADVPVGAYLSGGLDSSTTATVVRHYTGNHLRTFGIGFEDPAFDESPHQTGMVEHLGTDHSQIRCSSQDVGRVLPDVIWHTELPILRTSPAPMFLLSDLVHQHGFKVVLTGEGADEILGGYNIFKEVAIRRFWARQPESTLRPQLLRRIYPYIGRLSQGNDAYLRAFFGQGLTDTGDPFYSHRLRWRNTARCQRFLTSEVRQALTTYDPLEELASALPGEFTAWDSLAQAQYLEMSIFLPEYLLSSQGDRMTMAHSVEGRYPFLDHRVIEFCIRLPKRYKLTGLREKWLLKRAMADLLPEDVLQRPKQPYRAPIAASFFGPQAPEYVEECLSPTAIRQAGIFDPLNVSRLEKKGREGFPLGETDEMALMGIISTQLLYALFVGNLQEQPPISLESLYLCDNRSAVVREQARGTC